LIITQPIVSTQWLADNINEPSLRLFDASVYLTVNLEGPGYITESGRAKWSQSHIPGANFLEMLADFSDNSQSTPMMMHSAERFAELCGQYGIGNDSTVVIYSGQTMMWSARMWYMLSSMGFSNAAILDGGLEKWVREGRPMSVESTPYVATQFTSNAASNMWANKQDVLQAIHNPAVSTINALQPDIYDGRVNRYGRPGHIPGSHNVYYNSLLDPENGTFLPPYRLKKQFEATGALDNRTVLYCGGGVSATLDAIALAMFGQRDVAVYDGSMLEWCKDSTLPLVLGSEPG
jgi:thiosulfate/3-mercaptopyruvate sulfurtransferase